MLKEDILSISDKTKRGLNASPKETEKISDLVNELEKLNPIRKPFESNEINSFWTLRYTSSSKLIGKGSFNVRNNIKQRIDAKALTAENYEEVKYFGLIPVVQRNFARLKQVSDSKVKVEIHKIMIGPLIIPLPINLKGDLSVTYLDKQMRITRGNKGGLFVLTK
jgi:hypothetical protein